MRVLYDKAQLSEEERAERKKLNIRERLGRIKLPNDKAEESENEESTKPVSKEKPAPRPRHSPKYPQLKTFLSESWAEFPDSSSPSRVMKAKCVVSDDSMSLWTESVLSNWSRGVQRGRPRGRRRPDRKLNLIISWRRE